MQYSTVSYQGKATAQPSRDFITVSYCNVLSLVLSVTRRHHQKRRQRACVLSTMYM